MSRSFEGGPAISSTAEVESENMGYERTIDLAFGALERVACLASDDPEPTTTSHEAPAASDQTDGAEAETP